MKKQISIILIMAHAAFMFTQQESADTLYFSLDEAVQFAM